MRQTLAFELSISASKSKSARERVECDDNGKFAHASPVEASTSLSSTTSVATLLPFKGKQKAQSAATHLSFAQRNAYPSPIPVNVKEHKLA